LCRLSEVVIYTNRSSQGDSEWPGLRLHIGDSELEGCLLLFVCWVGMNWRLMLRSTFYLHIFFANRSKYMQNRSHSIHKK